MISKYWIIFILHWWEQHGSVKIMLNTVNKQWTTNLLLFDGEIKKILMIQYGFFISWIKSLFVIFKFLEVVLHSRKNMYFYFFNRNTYRKYDLKCKSKSYLDQKLCQFLFFHCDVIFEKLSKLGKISCDFLII